MCGSFLDQTINGPTTLIIASEAPFPTPYTPYLLAVTLRRLQQTESNPCAKDANLKDVKAWSCTLRPPRILPRRPPRSCSCILKIDSNAKLWNKKSPAPDSHLWIIFGFLLAPNTFHYIFYLGACTLPVVESNPGGSLHRTCCRPSGTAPAVDRTQALSQIATQGTREDGALRARLYAGKARRNRDLHKRQTTGLGATAPYQPIRGCPKLAHAEGKTVPLSALTSQPLWGLQ